jgi:iron(III) transport system permease protein
LKFNFQKLLFLGILTILCYLVIPPLFFIVQSSLYFSDGLEPARLSARYYAEVFSTPDTPAMLLNSIKFSVGSSFLSIVIGTLLAWIVERTNTPFKSMAYLSAFATFAVPGILKVIGWILLLGPEAGAINALFKNILGLENSPFNIYSMPGMILIEAVIWAPVVFLFMAASFRSMDPSLEESGTMSGAGIGKTFYHITLKLAIPSIFSVFLLNFIRSLESFVVPALLGIPGGIMVLSSEIYLTIQSGFLPRYGLAGAYAIILIVFVSIGLYFYSRITRRAQKYSTITGKGFRPRLIDVGKWRYLTGTVVLSLPAFLLLPLIILFWASLFPYYVSPSTETLPHITFNNYLSIFQNPTVLKAIKNSLFVGLMSATGVMSLTAVVAWVVVRTNVTGKWVLDHLASFTLVFPGVVLGVALLVTYLKLPIPIYGTIWIIVIAFITRYIPYGIRFCYPGLLQINRELEESAQMSGASWGTVFRKIVIPLMMPSLFAGWIYIFLHSVRGLSLPLLLSRPGTEVVAVLIFDMWENGRIPEISAFGISLTSFLLVLTYGFRKLSYQYGLQKAARRGI